MGSSAPPWLAGVRPGSSWAACSPARWAGGGAGTVNVGFPPGRPDRRSRVLPALSGNKEVRIDLRSVLSAALGMAALVLGWARPPSLAETQPRSSARSPSPPPIDRFRGPPDRGHRPVLPFRFVLNRPRAWAMIGLIVDGLSTYGIPRILTYRSSPSWAARRCKRGSRSSLRRGRLDHRRRCSIALMVRIPPRWLITVGIAVEEAGLIRSSGSPPQPLPAADPDGHRDPGTRHRRRHAGHPRPRPHPPSSPPTAAPQAPPPARQRARLIHRRSPPQHPSPSQRPPPPSPAPPHRRHRRRRRSAPSTVAMAWGTAVALAAALPIALFGPRQNARTPSLDRDRRTLGRFRYQDGARSVQGIRR